MKFVRPICAVCALIMGALPAVGQHDHAHSDIRIAKTAEGSLIIEFDFDEPIGLVPADGPLLFGCAHDDPGFFAIEEDEPDEGLFTLPPEADVVFELVAIDPAVKIYPPGFGDTLDMPGETYVLGPQPHVHMTFHIDSNHPSFDPEGVFSFTFRLTDASGMCGPSEEYVVLLACAEPGGCCLANGECEDGEFDHACEEEGGFFLGEGSVCSPTSCTAGACCFSADECEDAPEAECNAEGGEFQGAGTECSAAPCSGPFQPIPTTSEWGLLIIALTLAVAAKVYFTRRHVVS